MIPVATYGEADTHYQIWVSSFRPTTGDEVAVDVAEPEGYSRGCRRPMKFRPGVAAEGADHSAIVSVVGMGHSCPLALAFPHDCQGCPAGAVFRARRE
jgi:hypothetical protein